MSVTAVLAVLCGVIIWTIRARGTDQTTGPYKRDEKGFPYIRQTVLGIGLGCLGVVISLLMIVGGWGSYFAVVPFGAILLILSLLPLTAQYKLTDKELIFGILVETRFSLDELSKEAAVNPPYINNQKFFVISTGDDDWINLPLDMYYGGQDFAQILTQRLGTDIVYKDKRVAFKKEYLLVGALMAIYAIWLVIHITSP